MTKQRKTAPGKAARARPAADHEMTTKADEGVAIEPVPAAMESTAAPAIDLGSSCTLQEVAVLRTACIAALECKDPPAIDGTRVERVDAAGVQVLVGFTIDCMERSVNFSWVGRSPQLAHAIHLLGVDALLESPGAATPMGGMA